MKIREAQLFSDEVVDILKEERIKQGVSQYQIALDCEISKSALSYIEKHERRPTLYSLAIIAGYLGVNLSDVIKKAEKRYVNREAALRRVLLK